MSQRVVQVLVPCTDDFIGPFENEGHANTWTQMHGLTPQEYLAHDMIDPADVRAAHGHWSHLPDAMERQFMLVLSTAHLAPDTCNGWLHTCPWSAFPKCDYGWFVYVPPDFVETEGPDVPLEIRSAMHVARSKGFGWVMYDRDGPEVDCLPTYEW